MRGLYTGGVLDALMDRQLWADYVIGVSAGACNGVSYVSGQRGRNRRINTEYVGDGRYVGVGNFLRTGSMFGMDFIFGEIPEKLDPFDYAAFHASPCAFVAGVTDAQTGEPVYFGKEDMQGDCTVLRASSSIPCFAPAVKRVSGRRHQRSYPGSQSAGGRLRPGGGGADPGAGICQNAGAGPGGLPPCFPASAGDDSGAGPAP